MAPEFNDQTLIKIARFTYNSTTTRDSKLEKLFEKKTLNNDERNYILGFVDEYKGSKPVSMSAMKKQILTAIGYTSEYNIYSNTVNRPELEAIYNYIQRNFK